MTKDEIRKKWKNGELIGAESNDTNQTEQAPEKNIWQQVMQKTDELTAQSKNVVDMSNKKGGTAGFLGRSYTTGLKSGLAGQMQAKILDVANQLQKGEEKGKKRALLEAAAEVTNPTGSVGDRMLQAKYSTEEANKTGKEMQEQSLPKAAVNLLTSTASNAKNAMGFERKTNAVIQAIGAYFADKELSKKALLLSDIANKPITEEQRKLQEEAQQYGTGTQLLGQAVQSVGTMTPNALIGTVNPTASLAVMANSVKGNAAREALDKGADLDHAIKIGDTKGMIEAATEKLSSGLKIFGSGFLDSFNKNLRDAVTSKVGKFLLDQGLDLGEEVVEELVSDVAGTIIDRGTVDEGAGYSWEDFGKTAITTILSTAILNAVTGGHVRSWRQISNEVEAQKIENQSEENVESENETEKPETTKNQATTMENEPVSEQEQQTMPQQPKLPEKANSNEIEEQVKNGGMNITDYRNYAESVNKFGVFNNKDYQDYLEMKYGKDLKDAPQEIKNAWNDWKKGMGSSFISNEDFENYINEAMGQTLQNEVENVDINQENEYNNVNEGEIDNEFRRIQEEGSRLSNEERENLYGSDRTAINGIRENIRGLLSKKLEGYFSRNDDSQRTIKNSITGEDVKISQVSAEDFHNAFATNKAYMKNPDTVTIHPVDNYKDGKAYLTNDGMSGFFIDSKGDLQSVFNNSGKKGFLQTIADMVKADSKTLDCFQNDKQHLGDMYADAFGFKVASIMEFSREVMEEEFGKEYTDAFIEKYGEAPVYFMVNTDQNVETKNFTKDQYEEALEYRNKFVNNEGTQEEGSFLVSENAEAKLPEQPSLIKASEVNKQNAETTDENLEAIREANILNEPENQKVKKRQYNQSVKESDFVSEEAKKKFHEAFGDPTYIVKGNKEMISKMADEIDKYGIEESYNDFVKTFEENTRRMTVEDLIKGQLLMRYYSYAGEIGTEKFNRLDLDLGMLGTELGQAVQSMSIINRDTPETRLKILDTAIKRLSKENNDANLLISEETKQAIRDAGDNKELLDERMNEAFKEIANQLPRTWLDTMDSWRYLSMLGNPVTLIRNETGNFGNHWLMGAKKIVSGALQDLYGGTQNLLVKAGIKNENTFEKTATFKPANKDQRTFAQQDAELMGENIDSGQGNKYNDNTKSEIEKQRDAFNSRLANLWNEITMTTLDKRDTAYLKWAYKDALQNYMSANNLSSEDFKTDYSIDTGDVEQDRINKQQNEINAEKLEKARDYASRYACEATFHQFSAVAKAVNKFRASLNETIKSNDPDIKKGASLLTKIGMDSTLPFVRTTFNMGAQSLEFSPLGLYLSAGKMVHAATLGNQKLTQQYDNKVSGYATKFANNEITREVFDQKMEQAKTELNQKKSQMANNVIESAAKGLTGTAISLIAMAMTKSGMIKVRATDDDKDEKKIKNFLNIPEYSIQFGDTAIPIDWLAPVSIPFVIGMYMGKALEDDEDMSTLDKIMTASNASIKGSVGAVTNLSFMEGLLNAFRSYSSEATDNLESFVSNVASEYINQYIPTVVRKANKTFNPRIQDTTSTKKGTIGRTMEKTWKNVKAGLPIGEAYGAIKDVTGLRLPEAVDNFLEANPTRVDYKGDETSYDEKGVTSLLTKQFGDSTGIKVVGRLLDNFALPTSPSLIRNDEYSKELVKIAEATDDAGVIPDITSLNKDVSINKEKYRMGDREYNEAQKIYGKVSNDLISTLMKSEGYNKLSDTQKAELIKNIYSYAREEVKADYAKDHGLEFESSTTPAIKDMYNTINKIKTAGGKAEDYINYLVGAQNLTNKEERLRYLNSMNIKQSSKDAIYANDVATYVSYSEGKDSNYDALQVLNGGKARQGYLDYKQKSAENYFTNTDEKTGKSITGQKQQRVRDFLQNSDLSDIEKYYIYAKEGYACVKRGGGLTSKQRQKLRDALNNNKLNIDEETYNSMIKTLDEADANAKKWGINN